MYLLLAFNVPQQDLHVLKPGPVANLQFDDTHTWLKYGVNRFPSVVSYNNILENKFDIKYYLTWIFSPFPTFTTILNTFTSVGILCESFIKVNTYYIF